MTMGMTMANYQPRKRWWAEPDDGPILFDIHHTCFF